MAVRLLMPKYCTAPRSLTTSIMASVAPTTRAGRLRGRVMVKKVRKPLAPSERAAAVVVPDCMRKKARQAA